MNQPLALDMKSDLRKLLEHSGAAKLSELTVADYRKAFALFCCERFSQSGLRRHAAPIDFDSRRMDPVFELAATAKLAMLKGEHKVLPALYEQIAKCVIDTVGEAVDSKCLDTWGEIAHDQWRARHAMDHHAQEIAAEGRQIRAESAARWLEVQP
jgi:hypothetical protein